jgi:amidase/aspartyl-tRNA(Asn)/glutamyl-tRNA(Gln) amidotransferase subunit A
MHDAPDPTFMNVTEMFRRYRDKTLSPVEVLESTIARIELLDPESNAIAHTLFDAARMQASAAERHYARGTVDVLPLAGVPVVVKEDEPVQGQPWTRGSMIYKDLTAGHTSAFVRRIIDAGAIVHARSTAPEFSSAAFTQSRLWGTTRSPWNTEYSSGGSSGGSAVALATGMTHLATGSDVAGSIRTPSSFNGIVGFTPPYGRVPVDPPFNLDPYCHCGPMARTVSDCLTLQSVIAGPTSTDIASYVPASQLPDAATNSCAGMRIAVIPALGDWPVDSGVAANTARLVDSLTALGAHAEIIEVDLSRTAVMRAAAIHYDHVFGASISVEASAHPDDVTDYAREFARWARRTRGDATFLDGLAIEAELYSSIGALFDTYDALITPAVATEGFTAGDDYVGHGITVAETELEFYLEAIPAITFNILSSCPVLTIPTGFARNGMPTGTQIVTRPYRLLGRSRTRECPVLPQRSSEGR